jgi:large subunit ribosomal protein L7/L12
MRRLYKMTMTEETKKEDVVETTDPKASKDVGQADKADKKEVKVDAKLEKIIEAVEKLTILEMADLVKAMEEKFGVSAAVAAVGGGAGGGEEAEEKSDYAIMLNAAGDQKIQVIKVVREITGLGLKEAKDIVDGAPKEVKAGVPTAEAEEFKKKLETAGATVELK